MIAYSFLANFSVRPGFLHTFLKIHHYQVILATIAVSMTKGASFLFAHDVGNLTLFLNIYTFTLISLTYEKL